MMKRTAAVFMGVDAVSTLLCGSLLLMKGCPGQQDERPHADEAAPMDEGEIAQEYASASELGMDAQRPTAGGCDVKVFSSPRQVARSSRAKGLPEHGFAAADGVSCLVYEDTAISTGSRTVNIVLMDSAGKVVGTVGTSSDRQERTPSVVAAPWGGFLVAYHWTREPGEPDHVVARTMGYGGQWKDDGYLISSHASNHPVRIRNRGDRIGVWWQDFDAQSQKFKNAYIEIVDQEKQPASPAGEPAPLGDPALRKKLESLDGWPVAHGLKGLKIRWDGSRFVMIYPEADSGGGAYHWFSAACG